ncbi:MAG TPA: hypothetical protein VEV87_02885 [Chitinophagaceae bacterium]|nr:hypothetical protein [Chitinophagaceae bacterium]
MPVPAALQPMQEDLTHMIQKFPEYRTRIIDLYSSSDDFRTLCEDYYDSVKLFLHYHESVLNESKIENEYQLLCVELEKEALQFIAVK